MLCYSTAIDFNPLPPHGGRRAGSKLCPDSSVFQSTPSAWRETSRSLTKNFRLTKYFNPLPPHGGRRQKLLNFSESQRISIHSLRMEGDGNPGGLELPRNHFNPLPPHGGRPKTQYYSEFVVTFQSTPSAWRETTRLAHDLL